MSWPPKHPDSVDALFERRRASVLALADDAATVAEVCHGMARRFHRGGKLVVFGNGGPSTDAQHVAVEFVHPVIVGKRALPSHSLTADIATVTGVASRAGLEDVFAHQLRIIGDPADIARSASPPTATARTSAAPSNPPATSACSPSR